MISRFCDLAFLAVILSLPICCVRAEVSISPDTPISSLISSAKAARAQGHNQDALAYFDAAVNRNPTDYLNIFQRGATNLALGRNAQAKRDFDAVLKTKPGFEGALTQRAKIHARNAEWAQARVDYEELGAKGVDDLAQLAEAEGAAYLAVEAEKKQDWEACVNQAGIAILTAGTALSLRQLRARCRLERGEVQEGVSDLAHVLQIAPGLTEPHLQMSSMLFYSLGDTERGLAQVRKCLHSDPDSKPCKKLFREEKTVLKTLEKVRSLMDKKQYNSASKVLVGVASQEDDPGLLSELKENYRQGQASGNIHSKAASGLYMQHVEMACECYYNMNSLKKGAPYCTEALQQNPESLHGLLYKAQIQIDAEEYEAAMGTLNTAKEHHAESHAVQQKLQEAQTLLKRSKNKDYYKILGVSRDADEKTIKRAYRTATKQHHPDKAVARGVSKEEAEKKMAGINEAYEVLNDPELKAKFDQGEDPNDPLAQQGGNPFQGSPFGGGGGGQQQFFFQQGGGGAQFKFQGGGGGNPFGGFPFG